MFDFFKRDFMLGVGAGLIISGIMVSLSGNGQLSDEEVMDRAAKLGMVQKQEASQGQSGAKQEKSEPIKPEQDSSSGTDSTAPPSFIQEKVGVVTVEVKPGMGSESVARILEQKGAVSDREEFYKVMTKYNAHSKLKVGTFKIPAGTGMKGIVDILTGKAGK